MNVYFRVDASIEIGTGHLMRCLSLSAELNKRGINTYFISRDISEELAQKIAKSGIYLIKLETKDFINKNIDFLGKYSSWLKVSQEQDARETIEAIGKAACDWMVVDHYAIDNVWHRILRPHVKSIFVIDDLIDKSLECDLILNQNFLPSDINLYFEKNITDSIELIGPKYALLREEFYSLHHQAKLKQFDKIKTVLISLGGVDRHNINLNIARVLSALQIEHIFFRFVVGSLYPYKTELKDYCHEHKFIYCENVNNMAELMLLSDMAIGACGSSTWERCCLGLPTIPLILENNQKQVMQSGQIAGIFCSENFDARSGNWDDFAKKIQKAMNIQSYEMNVISKNCLDLVDGHGVSRVCEVLIGLQNSTKL